MSESCQAGAVEAMLEREACSIERGEEEGSTDQSRNAQALGASAPGRNFDTVLRIPVTVQVVLGSAMMPISNLLNLGRGAVVALDRRVGDPVEVVVNGRIVARGEIVVV